MGVVVDGCPAGVPIDEAQIQQSLNRRRPGSSSVVSQRQEPDQIEILSGVFESKTLGTPIAVIVKNKDQRSEDYKSIKTKPRTGHADDVWKNKYGHIDHRGGGRSSGRETLSRVIGGSIAEQLVKTIYPELCVSSKALQIGPLKGDELNEESVNKLLAGAKQNGKSYGGISQVTVSNTPAGLGQPVFKKIKSDLAQAMMSIGAVNAFSLGSGFHAVTKEGTEFHSQADSTNYGGIRGGITTGEDILFQVSFKPTSSVLDVAKKGRHDPCILLRAQVVLESMTCLVLADHVLAARLDRV